jgi:hypothetical protein
VAVGTKKDTFRRLGSNSLKRSGQASIAEPESLYCASPVMKLKSPNVTVVSADAATPARFLDQDLLESASPRGDGVGATA